MLPGLTDQLVLPLADHLPQQLGAGQPDLGAAGVGGVGTCRVLTSPYLPE